MTLEERNPAPVRIGGSLRVQVLTLVLLLLLMSNLNAMVDLVLHPEIPFFDKGHIIVGAATGLITTILFAVLMLYLRHLNSALSKIHTLEGILPICSHCKKIRKPNSDPNESGAWLPFESYITIQTAAQFSHGICPDCADRLYPQYRPGPGQA